MGLAARPGDDYRSDPHRTGTRELLHVLAGVVAGSEHSLAVGDAASFDGAAGHAYRNASATDPARFSLAVYEPSISKEQP